MYESDMLMLHCVTVPICCSISMMVVRGLSLFEFVQFLRNKL